MTLFADGEPLDVDKLNSLAQRVQDLESSFNSFTTRYDANNKRVVNTVPIIVNGSKKINIKKNNDSKPFTIPSNAFLTTDPVPSIYITVAGSKSGVMFAVNDVTRTSFTLDTYSPTDAQTITINWMAVSQRTLTN
jgi:hypothetical protein